MVWNFPPFFSEWRKRSTSESTPHWQFPNGISGKLPYHLTSNPNFRTFWPNGKHPSKQARECSPQSSRFLLIIRVKNIVKTAVENARDNL